MNKTDVIIVGGGPAGISAALWCKRLDLNHVLIESNNQLGGQLFQIHNKIIDYPGVLVKDGEEMQQLLEQQVQSMGCKVILDCRITLIDHLTKKISYRNKGVEKTLHYEYLIFSAGSKPKRLEVPGEKEMIERGEVYSATRDKQRFSQKKVVIVGGGDRAFEGAFLLAEEGAEVVLVHRSDHFRARKSYQQRVFQNKNIKILSNTSVLAIHGENNVKSIDVEFDGEKRTIAVDAVLVRIGVKPNTTLLNYQVETDDEGYIIVNQQGETTISTIFAIGDVCTKPKYSSISASVGQAMIAVKYISECLRTDDH